MHLLGQHHESLQELKLDRYSSDIVVRYETKCGLRRLEINSLALNQEDEWPLDLLTRNLDTLEFLSLGSETAVADRYTRQGAWSRTSSIDDTDKLGEVLSNKLQTVTVSKKPSLALKHLCLIGLNSYAVFKGRIGVTIQWQGLTVLRLYSCARLNSAIVILRRHPGMLRNLKVLHVRQERGVDPMEPHLELFLACLPPLRSLQVLLEGETLPQNLAPILKIHGKSLRRLVWDQRRYRRTKSYQHVVIMPARYGFLPDIAAACPNLEHLGMSLDWRLLMGDDNSQRSQGRMRSPKDLYTCSHAIVHGVPSEPQTTKDPEYS